MLRDILSAFALLGLGLASLGIYGVIARTMAQRAGEFAIRFALGACVRDITRIVLLSGVKMAVIGSVIGLVGSLAVTRFLASVNPSMHLNSPLVIAGTTSFSSLSAWSPPGSQLVAPAALIRSKHFTPSKHETEAPVEMDDAHPAGRLRRAQRLAFHRLLDFDERVRSHMPALRSTR